MSPIALLSVSDKTGLIPLAKALVNELGFKTFDGFIDESYDIMIWSNKNNSGIFDIGIIENKDPYLNQIR